MESRMRGNVQVRFGGGPMEKYPDPQVKCVMTEEIRWEPVPVRGTTAPGPRRALFFAVTHGAATDRVMLGIDEAGHCLLLEHLVEDPGAPRLYPYRQLPYVLERYERGEGARQFASVEEAMAYVEQQIRVRDAAQHQQ
jgi:hypothetical protein